MTDNDYIAEYVKEERPELLGFEFKVWKATRVLENCIKEVAQSIADACASAMDGKVGGENDDPDDVSCNECDGSSATGADTSGGDPGGENDGYPDRSDTD